jgi:hypothetical protein
MRKPFDKRQRRGMAIPEWAAVVGGVGAVIVFAVSQLGGAANTELQKTSEDMLNPAELAKRYHGNNGFGNGGSDGSPNGFQDETR